MKKHAIIPIFIPHKGCPNDCVFCNQKKITARDADVLPEDVRRIIEQYLTTLENRGLETLEVAFFGGSFTGIPMEEQTAFLAEAKRYKDMGKIDKIHLSTRPDYINEEILDNLKKYGVDVIELGVQSFDEDVLMASGRGHNVKAVEDACELIHKYGFTLGIQLMIGLPCDTKEKCIASAKKAVSLNPAIARLYPTVVIKETQLAQMAAKGEYKALSTEEAVDITKEMYKILTDAGVTVIRVGLKSSDLITTDGEESQVAAGVFHPAFRQLVEGEIAKDLIERKINELYPEAVQKGQWGDINEDFSQHGPCPTIVVRAVDKQFSNVIGHKGCNKKYFAETYPWLNIEYEKAESFSKDLPDDFIEVKKL